MAFCLIGFLLAVAYSATIGGLSSLVGTAPNIFVKGFADRWLEKVSGLPRLRQTLLVNTRILPSELIFSISCSSLFPWHSWCSFCAGFGYNSFTTPKSLRASFVFIISILFSIQTLSTRLFQWRVDPEVQAVQEHLKGMLVKQYKDLGRPK